MKKIALFALFVIALGIPQAIAQEDDYVQESSEEKLEKPKESFTDKLFFGGGLGLQFGTVTSVNISPLVGYQFIPSLSGGVIFIYNYYQDNRYTPKFSTHTYGGSVFLRWRFFKGFFVHGEFETLNGEWQVVGERYNINSLFLGGGYMIPLGSKSFMAVYLLFNVLDTQYSPYVNPILRFNFGIGL